MALNYMFVGLGDETVNVPSQKDVILDDLKNKIEQRGVAVSGYSFYHNGSPVSSGLEQLVVNEVEERSGLVVIRAYPRILGGKGGFGALIRSMGTQINKNRTRDACRDLGGRRMRDVNAEKKMTEWMKKEPERKRQKAEKRKKKRDRLLAEPRHFFNDPQYMQLLQESEEGMSTSLKQGMQAAGPSNSKRKADQEESGPSKKTKLWVGIEECEELDSGGEDGDVSSSSASDDSPATQLHQEKEKTPSSIDTDGQAASSPDHSTTPDDHCSKENTTKEESVPSEASRECVGGTMTTEHKTTDCIDTSPPEPLNLDEYHSLEELESSGGDRLKHTLQSMGLKCGGTVKERAERLLSVKGVPLDEIKPSLFAKPGKGKGKGKGKNKSKTST